VGGSMSDGVGAFVQVLIMDIRFPGEAQQIDRILSSFAARFYECNQTLFRSEDTVYKLSFSLMMLNTDLHNRNLNPKKKMKLEEFVRNNRGIDEGEDLPREMLETLYHTIKVRSDPVDSR
jgi:Sec7-like guanine-nucleotide exchange factor